MKILFKVVVIFVVLLVLGGVFYWYEWRPTQIRKECQWKTENTEYRDVLEKRIQLKLGGTEENDLYQICLREHGLEK